MSVFNKYREFEQDFEKELKRTPQDFIVMKYKAGSSPNAVQYLYEIVSAEIGKKIEYKSLHLNTIINNYSKTV